LTPRLARPTPPRQFVVARGGVEWGVAGHVKVAGGVVDARARGDGERDREQLAADGEAACDRGIEVVGPNSPMASATARTISMSSP
jgi:hypothetical protein